MGWLDLLSHWRAVKADLAAIYHLLPSDLPRQPWPGLRDLILSLPAEPGSRVARALGGGS